MRGIFMRRIAIAVAPGVATLAGSALAEPTTVTVRVISKGAKFVGSSMAGARITLRDVDTGELLATGVTAGSTGNTQRIMKDAHARGEFLSDETSAAFTAELDLVEPRLVEIAAFGPLAQRQSAARVAATTWLLPGKDITGGDAFLMELPGFVVDVLAPAAHVVMGAAPQKVVVTANVTMMCGCPLSPGGLWDSSQMEIAAELRRDGKRVAVMPLDFAGTNSRFEGTLDVAEAGTYEVLVTAFDPRNGNTGIDRTTFMVEKAK